MAQQPRIRTARAGLLGGANTGPMQSNASAAMIQGAGQSIARGLDDVAAARERIERNQAAQYVAEQAPAASVMMENLLTEHADGITADTVNGFTERHLEAVRERAAVLLEETPERARPAMREVLARVEARSLRSATLVEAQKALDFRRESFQRGAETASAALLTSPEQYDDLLDIQLTSIAELDVPESERTVLRDRAVQTLTESYFRGLIRNGDPQDALDMLKTGKFDERLGLRKEVVIGVAEQEIRSLSAGVKAAQTVLKNSFRDRTSFTMEALRDGVTPSDAPQQVLADLERAGLAAEMPDVVADLQLAATVAPDSKRFRREGVMGDMPAPPEGVSTLRQMEATVSSLEAEDRANRTRESEFRLTMARAQLKQVEERAENDPFLGMYEAKMLTDAEFNALRNIDVTQPDAWQTVTNELERARAYYGRPVTPYSSAQMEAITTYFESQPSDVQAAYLASMVAGMPQAMSDAVARQMSGTKADVRMRSALAMAARGRAGATEQILRGRKLLESDISNMRLDDFAAIAGDTDFAESFEGSAIAWDEYVQSAMAIYAANAPLEEVTGGEFNADRVQQALEALAGATPVRHNSKAVLPPVDGMTQDQFTEALRMIRPGDFTSHGRLKPPGQPFTELGDAGLVVASGTDPAEILTPEIFMRSATLTAAADGLYYVDIDGERITGRDGLPYAFDMRAFLQTIEGEGRAGQPVLDEEAQTGRAFTGLMDRLEGLQ